MTVLKQLLLLLFIPAFAIPLCAQQQSESVFRFLTISPDARTASLGGNHAAVINPQSSQFIINPAFAEISETGQVHLSYLNHLGDIRFGTANYAIRVPELGTLSSTLRYLNYGDMSQYDELGNDNGSTFANDVALTVGMSSSLSGNLSYGLSATGIYSSLTGYSSSAVALSGGLLYTFSDRETSIGAYLNNAGTQLSTYNGITEPLPLNIAVGVVHRLQYIPVRLHLTMQRLNNWTLENAGDDEPAPFAENLFRHMVGGAEFLFGDHVSARLGYDYWLNGQTQTGKRLDGAGVSIGVALKLNTMTIDFSRTSFSDMGSVVQLGVGMPL